MIIKENPLEQLDDFLKVFVDKKSENYRASIMDFMAIGRIENADEHNSVVEVEMILKKLIKDGFVLYEPQSHEKTEIEIIGLWASKNYVLSFEGKVFIQQGGYVEKEKNRITKEKANHDRNQRMERNEERLILWTKRLAYLTIVGALIIVSWEMYKAFCLHR